MYLQVNLEFVFFECAKTGDFKMNYIFVRIVLLIQFGVIWAPLLMTAQSIDCSIDLTLIKEKSVKEFIVEQHIDRLDNFFKIKSSWKMNNDVNSYHKHIKTFKVKRSLSDVWECYNKADPVQTWNGRKIDFGLLISKYTDSLLYKSKGSFIELDTGQVYFLNLKLLMGIFNIPVAFEIINIDDENKIIEFSYIDGNISKGKQTLQFIQLEDGTTQIVHRSYFRSDSNLRDSIYPYYHKKIIKGFHRNMRRNIRMMMG